MVQEIEFYKYQGTGNDFVIIDHRDLLISKKDTKLIAHLCNRKYGIGADGLILLESHPELDFSMVYFNADGNESSMCGNGGRCLVAFAKHLEIFKDRTSFEAIDGIHHATINSNGVVSLQMSDVSNVQKFKNHLFANTGSPHHIQFVTDINTYDVFNSGRAIRYKVYGDEGANVNFVEQDTDTRFKVRTYERGVEDETLSCGTGVTAVALGMHASGKTPKTEVEIQTMGGNLKVSFNRTNGGYKDVWLTGPAIQVFKGVVKP